MKEYKTTHTLAKKSLDFSANWGKYREELTDVIRSMQPVKCKIRETTGPTAQVPQTSVSQPLF